MKRTVVTIVVALGMAVAPAVAAAGTSSPKPGTAKKLQGASAALQSRNEGGQTLYRLGSSGLWMY